MSELPELLGSKVLLRKPLREDIDDRILFGSPIEFARMCGVDTKNSNKFTLDDGTQWYTKILEHPCKWVLHCAFDTLKYHKVYLRVLEYNRRAIRCYGECGFN